MECLRHAAEVRPFLLLVAFLLLEFGSGPFEGGRGFGVLGRRELVVGLDGFDQVLAEEEVALFRRGVHFLVALREVGPVEFRVGDDAAEVLARQLVVLFPHPVTLRLHLFGIFPQTVVFPLHRVQQVHLLVLWPLHLPERLLLLQQLRFQFLDEAAHPLFNTFQAVEQSLLLC